MKMCGEEGFLSNFLTPGSRLKRLGSCLGTFTADIL